MTKENLTLKIENKTFKRFKTKIIYTLNFVTLITLQ